MTTSTSNPAFVRALPLLLCISLAACGSSGPATAGDAGVSTSSAPASTAPAATPPASTAPPTTAPTRAPAGGAIMFSGALSGSMTIASCPQGGPAQLVVAIDGEKNTYAGVIDTEDFAFVGPKKSGYTLDKGQPKPVVAGGTYTVRKTRLVGLFDDSTITADGSVTCP